MTGQISFVVVIIIWRRTIVRRYWGKSNWYLGWVLLTADNYPSLQGRSNSYLTIYCFFLALSATFFLFALNVDLEEVAFFVILEVFAFLPAPVDFGFVDFLPALTLDFCDFAFGLFES